MSQVKVIVDIHHHLNTLNCLLRARGRLQGHTLSLGEHRKDHYKVILSVPLYANFYRDYRHLKEMIVQIKKSISSLDDAMLITKKSHLYKDFRVGVLLHIESARVLKNGEDQLEELFHLGVRGVIPVHFIDNHLGGSCDDIGRRLGIKRRDHGMTDLGAAFIEKCNELGMWIDVTHTTDKTGEDFVHAAKYVMASHVGMREKRNFKRNKSLHFLRKIAHKNGLVGLTPWCHLMGKGHESYFDNIQYAKAEGLAKSLCIGTDFGAPILTAPGIRSVFDIAARANDKDFISQNALNFFDNCLPH